MNADATPVWAKDCFQQMREAPFPIFWIDSNGKVVGKNRVAESVFGNADEPFDGVSGFKEWVQGVFSQLHEGQEFRFATMDGKRFFSVCGSLIEGGDGAILYFREDAGLQKMETRCREMSQALTQAKRELNQTSALALIGSWEYDVSLRKLRMSPVAKQFYEISEEEELTLEEALLFYKEGKSREDIQDAIRFACVDGAFFALDLEFVGRAGTHRWVRAVGLGEFEGDECVRLYGSLQDITGYKELNQKLEKALIEERRQNRYIADLTNALPIGIYQKNLTGEMVSCNPAFTALTGYSLRELSAFSEEQKTGVLIDWAEDDQALLSEFIPIARREGELLQKGGKVLSVVVYKSILHDDQGCPIGIVQAVLDITELKELEGELRTAKTLADKANQAKTQFLATMSHELRTPLNTVIGMTSLLEDSGGSEAQKKYLAAIGSAGETLLELINDILNYSKIENHTFTLEPAPFSFEELFFETVETFAPLAKRKGIGFSYFYPASCQKTFSGDRAQIKRVLANLLSNAIKFTSEGGVRFSAAGTVEESGNFRIEFQVEDSGIGISESVKIVLFQPFVQADSSNTRKYGGTGLGLAVSKNLAEMMGGTLELESEEGKGSTFFFSSVWTIVETPAIADAPLFSGKSIAFADSLNSEKAVLSAHLLDWGMRVLPFDFSQAGSLDFLVGDEKFFSQPANLSLNKAACRCILLHLASKQPPQIPGVSFAAVLEGIPRPSALKAALLKLLSLPATPSGRESSAQGGTKPELPALRIIVAEDNLNNQKVIRLILKQAGFQALIVENGALALDALETSAFDVVILDMQMPVMDGVTAMKKIRERFAGRADRPYCIALTANAFVEDEQICLAAGFDRYFSKPITVSKLREALVVAAEKTRFTSTSPEGTIGENQTP